ncbi:unnamed protein product, partial [Chrysoparadoxa australica]
MSIQAPHSPARLHAPMGICIPTESPCMVFAYDARQQVLYSKDNLRAGSRDA